MRFLGLGDNVVDCYLDEKIYYPGGNAVNVAVGASRAGCEAAYLGVFGDDEEAVHLQNALRLEGVAMDRCRFIHAISGHPGVRLTKEGDRVFVGGPQNTCQHIVRLRLTKDDLEYLTGFDICHTSCYSSIEPELEKMSRRCDISFDFSSGHIDGAYLSSVCPHIRFAFFSGSHMGDGERETLVDRVHGYGVEIVGVTLGRRGAAFSRQVNGERAVYRQGVVETKVMDTMGAGDSFIAGFLTRFFDTENMTEALAYAARRAAATCGEHGGFGHGRPLPAHADYEAWRGV